MTCKKCSYVIKRKIKICRNDNLSVNVDSEEFKFNDDYMILL